RLVMCGGEHLSGPHVERVAGGAGVDHVLGPTQRLLDPGVGKTAATAPSSGGVGGWGGGGMLDGDKFAHLLQQLHRLRPAVVCGVDGVHQAASRLATARGWLISSSDEGGAFLSPATSPGTISRHCLNVSGSVSSTRSASDCGTPASP